jgi:hypothetical protein
VVLRRARVEQQRAGLVRQRRQLEQLLGAKVGDEQTLAGRERRLERGDRIAIFGHDPLAQPVLVLEKLPGGLVLRERLARPHQPLVRQHRLHQRERLHRRLLPRQVGHLDLNRCTRWRRHQAQSETGQPENPRGRDEMAPQHCSSSLARWRVCRPTKAALQSSAGIAP